MTYADTTALPMQLRNTVESELGAGERIMWLAQPIPSRMARGTLPLVLFGIPWTAFAVFWVCGAAAAVSKGRHGAPGLFSFFPLFGVPFILVGIGMLTSPWWARRSATRTAYVLTDRRAMVVSRGWNNALNVRSFAPEHLTDVQRKQFADGSGDVVFTQEISRYNRRNCPRDIGFLGVRDVKAVEEMVRALAVSGRARV